MRFVPASLAGRLALGGFAFTVIALLVTLVVMDGVFERFVTGQIDQRLDNKLVALAAQVRVAPDGLLSIDGDANGPPFDEPRHQSLWWVGGPRNAVESRWLAPGEFRPPSPAAIEAAPVPPRPPGASAGPRPRSLRGEGPDAVELHMRVIVRDIGGTPVTLLAAAPRKAIAGPMREALSTLGTAIALLGIALVVGGAWLGRVVLAPLQRLRTDVADVRLGRRATLHPAEISEIGPLVEELNTLLMQNAATLARARKHVANLAHGLKTPLATLSLGIGRLDHSARADLAPLVDSIERRVRHHLGRARAAALDGAIQARAPLAPRLADIVDALKKIHADKAVCATLDCRDGLVAACEPQDVDEILGNLLDNAFKYSRAQVDCRVREAGSEVEVEIADDGPGLAAAEIARVLQPGQRLDEEIPGFGFGLPIARELVELYGGQLMLGSTGRGLRVSLRLPKAP